MSASSATAGFNEDELVEKPSIAVLANLGWRTASGSGETFGARGSLGRETRSDVTLSVTLRQSLARLNADLPAEALEAALQELTRDRAAMGFVAANRELWTLMRDGVPVSVADATRESSLRTERVRVIDWNTVEANDFLLVSQLTIAGTLYTCRPDLIGFVNGLPWVVIELKKPGVPAKQAFDGNLTSYKHTHNGVPQLFWSNALLIASNGTDTRRGSSSRSMRFHSKKRSQSAVSEPTRLSVPFEAISSALLQKSCGTPLCVCL